MVKFPYIQDADQPGGNTRRTMSALLTPSPTSHVRTNERSFLAARAQELFPLDWDGFSGAVLSEGGIGVAIGFYRSATTLKR